MSDVWVFPPHPPILFNTSWDPIIQFNSNTNRNQCRPQKANDSIPQDYFTQFRCQIQVVDPRLPTTFVRLGYKLEAPMTSFLDLTICQNSSQNSRNTYLYLSVYYITKDIIKDHPNEAIHFIWSISMPSTEASGPIELGVPPSLHMDVFTNLEVSKPQAFWTLMEASSHRHIRSLTQSPAALSFPVDWSVWLKVTH